MWVLELLVLSYFVFVVSYTALFSFGGLFYRSLTLPPATSFKKFCVLIPSYKEDAVILSVARQAVKHPYPADAFDVVVIADSLKPETIVALKQLRLQVVEVSFTNSTKVKSINKALEVLPDGVYDAVALLDADNVMEDQFLHRMNGLLQKGYRVIQGRRKAKNDDNSLAFLDGASEAINNYIYRQGTVALGMPASIIGSGIVFDYKIFKSKLTSMVSVGGFDRELELLLLKDHVHVYYDRDAIVYDEKVAVTKSFENQRKRWIASQFFYLRKYFKDGMVALFTGNFLFFKSSIITNIQLPRLINLGLLTLLTFGLFFVRGYLHYGYTIWAVLFCVNILATLLSLPREFYSRKMFSALLTLPMLFVRMFSLLFKLKGANRKFIHTPHGQAQTLAPEEPLNRKV